MIKLSCAIFNVYKILRNRNLYSISKERNITLLFLCIYEKAILYKYINFNLLNVHNSAFDNCIFRMYN